MSITRHMVIPSLALALAGVFGACNGLGTNDGADDRDGSGVASAPAAKDPKEERPTEQSEGVIGYLTAHCAEDSGGSAKVAGTGKQVVSCVIRDEAGRKVEASAFAVAIKAGGGETAAKVVATDEGSPWQVSFEIDKELAQRLEAVTISMTPKGSSTATTATTDNLDFDWQQDPAFSDLVAGLELIFQGMYDKPAFDVNGGIKGATDRGEVFLTAFASDKVYHGDVTRAAADAYCQEAGAKLLPQSRWLAVMSTGSESAKSRLKLPPGVNIYNYKGDHISVTDKFFDLNFIGAVKYAETGVDVAKDALQLGGYNRFIVNAWVGTRAGGEVAQGATCGDWTSASAGSKGNVLSLDTFYPPKPQFTDSTRTCDLWARVLCLSQPAD